MTVPSDRDPAPHLPAESAPAAGFLRVLGAVFSSFLGIRRKASGERDMVTIKPVHVIVAGVLGAAVFVALLVLLVTVITRKA
jgi:hypothetical protein